MAKHESIRPTDLSLAAFEAVSVTAATLMHNRMFPDGMFDLMGGCLNTIEQLETRLPALGSKLLGQVIEGGSVELQVARMEGERPSQREFALRYTFHSRAKLPVDMRSTWKSTSQPATSQSQIAFENTYLTEPTKLSSWLTRFNL